MSGHSVCRGTMTVLVLLGLAAGFGCDRGQESSAPPPASDGGTPKQRGTIGVSVLTLSNPFFKEMADAMTAEAGKHGYAVRVVSSEMDPARQRDQVKDFLVSKVSAIILTP